MSNWSVTKALWVIGVVLVILLLCGLCSCESIQKTWKHSQSSWGGLDRTISVYSHDGKLLKTYEAKAKIEVIGDSAGLIAGIAWLDDDNREVKVINAIIVVQER